MRSKERVLSALERVRNGEPFKLLTRQFGIRQQAIYLNKRKLFLPIAELSCYNKYEL